MISINGGINIDISGPMKRGGIRTTLLTTALFRQQYGPRRFRAEEGIEDVL